MKPKTVNFFFLFLKSVLFFVAFSFKGGFLYCAQEETAKPATLRREEGLSPTLPSPAAVQDAPPLVQGKRFEEAPLNIYLMEKDGKIISYIPHFSIEEFELIRQHLQNSGNPEPTYSIQKIDAVGEVKGKLARIDFQFEITTLDHPVVLVSLGLHEGIFLLSDQDRQEGSPDASKIEPHRFLRYTGEGSCEIGVDSQTNDYLLTIRNPRSNEGRPAATSDQANEGNRPESTINLTTGGLSRRTRQHSIGLTLCFPVGTLGQDEQRLVATFPGAVGSRIVLTVPVADAVPTVNQGGILRSKTSPQPESTRFEIQGITKTLDVSWRKAVQAVPEEKPLVLHVEDAKIIAQLNNREAVFEATLPVRSVGGPLQRFQVRLPQGTRWVPSDPGSLAAREYEVREILEPTPGEKNDVPSPVQAPLLEVAVLGPPKQDVPFPVQIKAIRTFVPEDQLAGEELAGFEVVGAERQFGRLEVEVPNDLHLNWKCVHGIREDEEQDVGFREGFNITRFAYYSQPFSLHVKVVSPQTRINVKPEYQIQIEKGQIVLSGKLFARISGSKTNRLSMRLFDWHLDEIGPANKVDVSGIASENESGEQGQGTTTIPLLVRSDGPVELDIKLSRPMPSATGEKTTVRFPIPMPVADRIEPATVVIVSADNLELIPSETEPNAGLSRMVRNSVSGLNLPPHQQDPLIFRVDAPEATFVSDVVFHKQRVFVQSRSEIRLLEQQNQVSQTLNYSVLYEPLDALTLLIPKSVDENGSMKLFLDFEGKTVDLKPASFGEPFDAKLVRRRFPLPGTFIGNGTLRIQYSFEPTEIQRQTTTRMTIPLIVPAESGPVDQQVVALARSGVNIFLSEERSDQNGSWKKLEKNGTTDTGTGVTFVSSRWETSIPFYVTLDYFDVLGTTVVEKAWVQTWLSQRIRMDHAFFRISSDHEVIAVHLPGGFEKRQLVVQWDNETIRSPQYASDGTLLITQRPDQRGKSHLLDVKYQMPAEPRSFHYSLELPHFDEDIWVRQTYWQVVLPRNQLIFQDSPGWTSEYQWGWEGPFWGRIPSLKQKDLEVWIGSSEDTSIPLSQDTGSYLFSAFQPPTVSVLYIVDQTQAVFLSSGTVLLIGLCLIYFPRLRQGGVLFVLAVVMFSILFYQPTPALLFLQTSIVGLVLALFVGALARIFSWEEHWKTPPYLPSNLPVQSDYPSDSSGTPVPDFEMTHREIGNKTLPAAVPEEP